MQVATLTSSSHSFLNIQYVSHAYLRHYRHSPSTAQQGELTGEESWVLQKQRDPVKAYIIEVSELDFHYLVSYKAHISCQTLSLPHKEKA